ncbi:MAG TPA: sugar isomerase domain-containing protein [Clostridiaceae bacterium]|nr:sugar isomerase domain-containing protein [Clostridiaceae bacterium]
MLMEKYFESMKKVLEKIENTQRQNISICADVIVKSLCNNGIWHLLDTGHMLMYEGVGRAGGMMAVRPIRITVDVSNPTRRRQMIDKKNVYLDEIEGFPDFVLSKANIAPGDVLMIGSVSGKNILPVEIALKAKKMGVHTIAITSVKYSGSLKAEHPSGKRLFEVCDYVLDNCGEIGDALVYVDELGKSICPSSGIASSYIMWALQAEVVEKMLSIGKKPSIYVSNHLDNASRINNQSWSDYENQGY